MRGVCLFRVSSFRGIKCSVLPIAPSPILKCERLLPFHLTLSNNSKGNRKKSSRSRSSTMYLRQASALALRQANLRTIRGLATGKDLKFGVEGRALMLQGVDMLADAVQVRQAPGFAKFSSLPLSFTRGHQLWKCFSMVSCATLLSAGFSAAVLNGGARARVVSLTSS